MVWQIVLWILIAAVILFVVLNRLKINSIQDRLDTLTNDANKSDSDSL